jgi:hypothetical protein
VFRIDPNPVFTATVNVRQPGVDNVDTFKARFRALPVSKFTAYDFADPAATADFLRDVIVGLDDLEDAEGRRVAYSEEVREAVIDLPHARNALWQAYVTAFKGASEGNSDGPLVRG